jgi:hypothetical protein
LALTRRYWPPWPPSDNAIISCDFSSILPPGVGIMFPGADAQAGTPASGSVTGLTLTANGSYTAIPAVTIDAPELVGGSVQATATANLLAGSVSVSDGGSMVGFPSPVNSQLSFGNGIIVFVTAAHTIPGAFFGDIPAWTVDAVSIGAGGSLTGAPGTPVPASPMQAVAQSGSYTIELWPSIAISGWSIGSLTLTNGGSGYSVVPNVTIAPGPATATATAALTGATPGIAIPTPRLEIYTNLVPPEPAIADWTVDAALAPPGAADWVWVQSSDGTTAAWQQATPGVTIPTANYALGTAVHGRMVYSAVAGGVAGQDYMFRWIVTDTLGNRWTRTGLVFCSETS